MGELTEMQKKSMIDDRLAYMLMRLREEYHFSWEKCYMILTTSKTYKLLCDSSTDLYYKHKEGLFELLSLEYKKKEEDWFNMLLAL